MKLRTFYLRNTVACIFAAVLAVFPSTGYSETKGKKVLLIDSYHQGYAWSDGIIEGAKNVAKASNVTLSIYSMDTKRNASKDFKKKAGLLAKAEIEKQKPDVVIACDDNASRYLVEPYYKDASLPFVFCGVNLDETTYDYPYKNATGIVEVSIYNPMLDVLASLAGGDDFGVLGTDKTTPRKEAAYLINNLKLDFSVKFPADFEEWKSDYLTLQEKTDFIIIWSSAGLPGWDAKEARQFILENSKKPSGTTQAFMMPYALIGFVKVAQEQGEWSMKTAIKILGGKNPDQIPVSRNKRGRLLINDAIANTLNIQLPVTLVEIADIIDTFIVE